MRTARAIERRGSSVTFGKATMTPSDDSHDPSASIKIALPVTIREFAELSRIKPFKVISDVNTKRGSGFASMFSQMTAADVLLVGKRNGIAIELVEKGES